MLKHIYFLQGVDFIWHQELVELSVKYVLPYCRENNIEHFAPYTFILTEEELVLLSLVLPYKLRLSRVAGSRSNA